MSEPARIVREHKICWSLLGLFVFVYGIILMLPNNKGFSIKPPSPAEYSRMKTTRFKDKIRLLEINKKSQSNTDLHTEMSESRKGTAQNILKKDCTSAFEASSSGQWKKLSTKKSQQIMWLPNQCIFKAPNRIEITQISKSNNVSRIVFLGDSKTYRLSNRIREVLRCTGPVIQRMGGRCTMDRYLGVKVNVSQWSRPRNRQEGPCHFGLSNPGCTDCNGCLALRRKCSHGVNSASTLSVEYIPMEFARDVEIQSAKYGSTQEHVVEYLQRTGKPDIVVFNAGLHDLAYANLTAYYDNLSWLTNKLVSSFSTCKFLFINNSGVLDTKIPVRFRNITSNAVMHEHNKAANEIMNKLNVSCLDQWTMSNNDYAINNLHEYKASADGPVSPVHMTGQFYSQSADMVLLEIRRWYPNRQET